MELQGLLSGTAVTQSDLDTTPGRLLKVGDYGLGGTARPIPGNDADQIGTTGFYQVTGATLNRPAGMGVGTLQHIQHGAARAIQIAYPQTATDTGRWCRQKDTTWGDWFLTYDQRNIVGAVSWSSGFPRGGIIERARRPAPNMCALRMGHSFAAWSRPGFRVRPSRRARSIAPNGRR